MSNHTLFLYTGNGSLAFQDRAGGGTLTGSGAVRYAPAEGARINYVLNPRFASATTGWAANGAGASISRVTDAVFSGGFGLEITGSTTNEGAALANVPMRGVNLADGAAITISFDVYLVSGAADWRIRTLEADASGTQVSGTNGTTTAFTATASSQRITVNTVIDVGATPGAHGVAVYFRRASASTGTIRISNVVVEAGTVADPSYFDGSTGGVWLDPTTGILGTAHASPSVSQAVAWVEEGTTNLHPNPSFENAALNNAVAVSSTTLTKDTVYAVLGSASCKAVTPNAVSGEGVNFTTASSLGYTGSSRTFQGQIKIRGSGTVNVYVFARYSDATFENLAGTTKAQATLGDTWTLVTPGTIATNAAKTVDYIAVTVRTQTQQAATFYVDCVQIEEKSYATSYCDGSLGTGYAWTGTAHASSSTRTTTVLSCDEANRVGAFTGSIVARANPVLSSTYYRTIVVLGRYSTPGEDNTGPYFNTSNRLLSNTHRGNGYTGATTARVASPAPSIGAWVMAYSQYSASSQGVALDAGAVTTAAINGTPIGTYDVSGSNNNIRIGNTSNLNQSLNGYIGPVLIADRPLTAKERATLNANGTWTFRMLAKRDMLLLRR